MFKMPLNPTKTKQIDSARSAYDSRVQVQSCNSWRISDKITDFFVDYGHAFFQLTSRSCC